MKLKVLSMEDCEQVRLWRNECLNALRTPYPLTKEQQKEFYLNVVCNRDARARFWGVTTEISNDTIQNDFLIGMVGIENIEWENRRGEISIVINPEWQHAGMGKMAVDMLLEKGFDGLNLENIWGECFTSNPALKFWETYTSHFKDTKLVVMPNTKYRAGIYDHSVLFNIDKGDWYEHCYS